VRVHSSFDDSNLPAPIAFHTATIMGKLFFHKLYRQENGTKKPFCGQVKTLTENKMLQAKTVSLIGGSSVCMWLKRFTIMLVLSSVLAEWTGYVVVYGGQTPPAPIT